MAGHDCLNNTDDDGNDDLVCGQGRKILGTWNQSELDCCASRYSENDVIPNESPHLASLTTIIALQTMEWPLKDPAHANKFVTTPTNQEIWLRVAAVAISKQDEKLQSPPSDWLRRLQEWQTKVQRCSSSKWRFSYQELIGELVQIMSEIPSPQLVMKMCQAGLLAAQELMVIRIDDATNGTTTTTTMTTTVSAKEAFYNDEIVAQISKPLSTVTFHGSQTDENDKSPWSTQTGISQSQLQEWAKYGCMEESAAKHAANILVNSNTIVNDLSQFANNKLFVLLGATSEMGPTSWLMNIPGAHLLAIARPGRKLQALVSDFQATAHSSTMLQVPSTMETGAGSTAGVDMLAHGPHIARWVVDMARAKSKASGTKTDIVLCSLAYLDGEAHVRVSVAMDLIVEYVIQHWTKSDAGRSSTGSGNVVLWYLTSPTTVLAIPPQAAQQAEERYQQRPTWQRLLQSMSWGKWLQPTLVWEQPQQQTTQESADIESNQNHPLPHILNNLVTLQGPNYALAKSLQQWRCMVEDWRSRRDKVPSDTSNNGMVMVVAPCGPPTRTQNMVSHPQIAASLDGLDYFPPMMAFSVQDASLIMTAILISMTRAKYPNNEAPSEPANHPLSIFWEGSVHGGYWQCPYQSDSVGVTTYVLGSTLGKWKTTSSSSSK